MEAIEFLEGLRKRWTDAGAPQEAIQPIDDALIELRQLQNISHAAYHLLGVYKPPDFAPGAFKTAWRSLDLALSERNG